MTAKADQNRREADRWLRTAEQDLQTARWLREGEFFNAACFHAHQSGEKALKAFLLARGERGVRGHSGVELLHRCMELSQDMARLLPDCRVLDRHYIPTRYPDALPDAAPHEAFGPEDADDAIRRAQNVVVAVKRALASSEPPI